MLRGVSFEWQTYILEDDKESEVQTVFYLKPMTGGDANYILAKYGEARSEGPRGQVKLKVGRLNQADETTFVKVVKKIENYQFGDRFPAERDKGLQAVLDTEDQIRMVAHDMPPAYHQEIVEQGNKISAITEPEKNASSSSSTLSSGDQKKEKGAGSGTAKHAE